jgi:hypothetical protein
LHFYLNGGFMNQYQSRLNIDDDDLSGCLASQPVRTKQSQATPKVNDYKNSVNGQSDDDDLSGCLLSTSLTPKQTFKKTSRQVSPPSRPVENSGDLESGGLGSDWLYMN